MAEIQNLNRILKLPEFMPIRQCLQKEGKRLVWTNGCFDLLHAGHVLYLQRARQLGDVLVVGLNSDRSFQQWKRRPGPIQTQIQRATVLLGLRSVDYVILFDEPSPLLLLQTIRPEVYVKGDDYSLDVIDQKERAVVESYGGKIAFCSGAPELSTSSIIQRILRLYGSRPPEEEET